MRHTWLWLLILQALLYHLFYGGAQSVLGPIVVGDAWAGPAWGWALSAMMVGFVVGGLVTLRWRPRHALFVGTCFLALTAAFPFAMAWSDSLAVVLVGAWLHGFGLEIFSVGWDLSIQEQVEPDKLARVYSFDMIGSFIARPVGLVLTGPLATLVGYRSLAHGRGRGDRRQRARRAHLGRRTPARAQAAGAEPAGALPA